MIEPGRPAGGPWYAQGLRFECVRCGRCCTGAPGDVWVGDEEIRTLQEHSGLSPVGFRRAHLKASLLRPQRLREKVNCDCTFYEPERGCRVYALRPRQCRTWPFWRQSLRSPEAWAEAAATCPGMNQGRLYTTAEIERLSSADGLPQE